MKAGAFFLSMSLCLAPPSSGGEEVLVHIEDLDPGDVEVEGFELTRDQTLRLKATGLEAREAHDVLTSAWILDSDSRRVVWRMGTTDPVDTYRGFRDYEETVRLGAGRYEAYYATYPDAFESDEAEGWWQKAGRAIRRFAEDRILRVEPYEEATQELRLVVRGIGRDLDRGELEETHRHLRDRAVVAIGPAGDDLSEERGFELDQPTELEVYALGELNRHESFDYGWIIDVKTRRKVWSFEYEASERAGGNGKNRIIHRSLQLPAGRYAAFYVTDESHSAGDWNTLPPRDPAFWGLTLWPRDPDQRPQVRHFSYSHLPQERVIVDLTRLVDNQSVKRGITLTEPMGVRIFALGEGLHSGMADFGWIVDARTRETVWKMDYDKTRHAGGSKKNRLVDEVVRLAAGSYLVAFVTDGSHAYRDWNSKPPPRPERWGITLLAADEDFMPAKVASYQESDDTEFLARIAKVTDGRHMKRSFSLDARSRIAIYALGEGLEGHLHDYGWIEQARTGDVVWEMALEETSHAGGAVKNRLAKDTVELEPGAYVLNYQSDDSHSYGDWNEPPPHDPEAWGIRIALVHEDG